MTDARLGGGAPTVLRVVLGKRFQTLREQVGLFFEQAARVLDVTHATVRRIEKAEVAFKIPYVEKLLLTYGVTDRAEADGFLALAREANQPGWWHRYRDVLPDWFSVFVSLEQEASVIWAYEPHSVPGLLRTEDYARAVLRAGRPGARDEEIERGVALRMERQALLDRETAPLLWIVMDETVLRRPIGGSGVERAQIARLIEACALPKYGCQSCRSPTARTPRCTGHSTSSGSSTRTAGRRVHGESGGRRRHRRPGRRVHVPGDPGPDVRAGSACTEHRGNPRRHSQGDLNHDGSY